MLKNSLTKNRESKLEFVILKQIKYLYIIPVIHDYREIKKLL